ncbi:hypothetical protein SKAU_G00106150 [Synaphobranchus kaupii]|uniref:Uncharacterized protein n=1 Tax=Synaphobranchus kaupii TaxID=118154 RepID=A0A9Q1FZS1_SYNKA|nr:hypothetical protein SKAU_G00106150 [Synaphobranchus kaupii]
MVPLWVSWAPAFNSPSFSSAETFRACQRFQEFHAARFSAPAHNAHTWTPRPALNVDPAPGNRASLFAGRGLCWRAAQGRNVSGRGGVCDGVSPRPWDWGPCMRTSGETCEEGWEEHTEPCPSLPTAAGPKLRFH